MIATPTPKEAGGRTADDANRGAIVKCRSCGGHYRQVANEIDCPTCRGWDSRMRLHEALALLPREGVM